MFRRVIVGLILGPALLIGSLAWSGYLALETVFDEERSETIARELLDNDEIHDRLIRGSEIAASIDGPHDQLPQHQVTNCRRNREESHLTQGGIEARRRNSTTVCHSAGELRQLRGCDGHAEQRHRENIEGLRPTESADSSHRQQGRQDEVEVSRKLHRATAQHERPEGTERLRHASDMA